MYFVGPSQDWNSMPLPEYWEAKNRGTDPAVVSLHLVVNIPGHVSHWVQHSNHPPPSIPQLSHRGRSVPFWTLAGPGLCGCVNHSWPRPLHEYALIVAMWIWTACVVVRHRPASLIPKKDITSSCNSYDITPLDIGLTGLKSDTYILTYTWIQCVSIIHDFWTLQNCSWFELWLSWRSTVNLRNNSDIPWR